MAVKEYIQHERDYNMCSLSELQFALITIPAPELCRAYLEDSVVQRSTQIRHSSLSPPLCHLQLC